MSLQKLSFNLYQQTVKLIKTQRMLFLDLGFLLGQIKNEKLYLNMGEGGFDSWKSFLSNPEINISPSTAEVYIRVYEFYINKLQMPKEEVLEIPLVRLNAMKSKLEGLNQEDRDELIEKAKTLSYNDFIIETSPKPRAIKVSKCEKCGKLIIKYDPEQVCTCVGIIPYDRF